MGIHFKNDWEELLSQEFDKSYYKELRLRLVREYKEQEVYPSMFDIFNAFHATAYEDVKCVILGQDPYHGTGQAHGLSFSVKPGIPIPPSLQNIYKELHADLGCTIPTHGCLDAWSKQGVLLLNTSLTVRAHQANSHAGLGWERLTDRVIELLNEKESPIVFVLWGAKARAKKKLISSPRHLILESAHPSPLSAYNGFFGSKPFSKANAFLISQGLSPIDWQIPFEQKTARSYLNQS